MIRQHFYSPILAAALLCGFTHMCLAETSKATDKSDAQVPVHAPMDEWSVGPISVKSANGASYCSMKNAYQSGQTLVFARDNQGSNSIALDFHKDLFGVGQQYDVKARVGTVSRSISALAASKQVLVMQLGVDTLFFNAVKRKHNIVFTVISNKYGFDLDVSVADALGALGKCTDSFQGGAVFTEARFPLGKVTDVAALQQSAEEEDVSSDQSDEAPAPKKHRSHKIAKAKKSDEMEQQVQTLQNQNRDLTLQNEKIQRQLAGQNEPGPAPVQSQGSSERDEMKAEIASEILQLRSHPKQQTAVPAVQQNASAAPATPTSIVPVSIRQPVENTDLKKLLEASHVVSGQQLKTADNSSILRWTSSDDLYGSAQSVTMAPGKNLTDVANGYLQKAASLCKGAFAKKMGTLKKAGKTDVLEAEITCIDGQNDAAAAVLFVAGQGNFSVITQEGTADQLTTAMSNRDAIVSAATAHNIN